MEWYKELAEFLGSDPLILLLAHAGAFAGAISGIRMACIKRFDWFGAYVVGIVTALGGGTLRDIMLQVPPFWMTDPSFLVNTFVAQLMVFIFGRRFISEAITWFIFDTIAISLFTVFGMEATLRVGYSWWVAVFMGVITAVFGGILRDVLINDVPLIFRKEIYAMACVAGALLYVLLIKLNVSTQLSAICCVALIFILRALAIRFGWRIPVLTGHQLHIFHR